MTTPNEIIPYGFCHCACGERTGISHGNNPRLGWVAGEPFPYIANHRKRQKVSLDKAVAVTIEGEDCYSIPLTQGKRSIISAAHLERVMTLKWRARKNVNSGNGWYAMRTERVDGRNVTVMLHHFILDMPDVP